MKFSCEIEDIHLTIEAKKEKFSPTSMDPMPYGPDSYQTDETSDFYAITLTSSKNDITLTHYLPGQVLSNEAEEMQADIEHILDEDGIIETLLEKWDLVDSEQGPKWRDS